MRYIVVLLSSVLMLFGCASYAPKPLTDAPLAAPDKHQLEMRAALLAHQRLPALALDFSKPLSPQQSAVIAVLANPDLQALRAKEGVMSAQVFDAGLLPDPQLNASYDRLMQPMAGLFNAYNVGVSWSLAGLVTRSIKVNAAKALRQQYRYDLAWQEWQVANQAELLVIRIHYLQEQVRLIERATAAAEHLLALTETNLRRHDSKIDEFSLRQSSYLDLHEQQQVLARNLHKTEQQLYQLLGMPPNEQLALTVAPGFIPDVIDADSLFTQARKQRLDLLALQAGYSSADAKYYQAILGQFPSINLGIARARDNTAVNSLGPTMSFDLPIFNRNRGAIAIAHATREQLNQEYHARLHQTRADIATLVTELRLLKKQVAALNKQLPILRQSEQLMRDGLIHHDVTQISYEEMRSRLLNSELKLIQLRQDAAEQQVALQLATGQWNESIN
jgi:cobalt-zinc-cadmium efflux system outer membrane protein